MGKSRVFRSWMRSYYIVLLFPVLLSTAVFLNSSLLIRRQLNTADLATLESAKDTVDTQFRGAFDSMAYVITNTSAQTIKNRKAISGDDYAALNVLHEMVRRYSVQSPELINLFVFFPNSDRKAAALDRILSDTRYNMKSAARERAGRPEQCQRISIGEK